MGACTLAVDGHVVVRCEGGLPEAEYALFEEGDVELRSLHPGSHREASYATTAARARGRLAERGATAELARAAAESLAHEARDAYARGPAARMLAPYLGAAELFAGGAMDVQTRRYRGAWLDLEGLAIDCGVDRAAAALQALHLAALLAECEAGARVVLVTQDVTRDGPAGVRTFRRVSVEHAASMPAALAEVSGQVSRARPAPASATNSREDLLAEVQARIGLAPDAATQERLLAIERGLLLRPRPAGGPLADDALWALELQLTVGHPDGVAEACDILERTRGRHPATAYLRARAALLAGREPPLALAERVSALASSMDSFRELELLAAQAWAAAGELGRAAAYARDVEGDPNVHAELRARAADLARDAEAGRKPRISAAPPAATGATPPPPRVSSSVPPPGRASAGSAAAAPRASGGPAAATPRASAGPAAAASRASGGPTAAASRASGGPTAAAASSRSAASRGSAAPGRGSGSPIRTFDPRSEPPDDAFDDATSSGGPDTLVDGETLAAAVEPAPLPAIPRDATLPSLSYEAEVIAHGAPPLPAPARTTTAPMRVREGSGPPGGTAPMRAQPGLARAAPIEQSPPSLRGGSQPPLATVAPPAPTAIPAQPMAPPAREGWSELVEKLTLPPGLHGQSPTSELLPRTVLDARVLFTYLARDLAREIREKRGHAIRTDAEGVEAVQREVRALFPPGTVIAPDIAYALRRHGAFLSEVLARTLGAYWMDISASEMGYWAMHVPTRGRTLRVLPFGRVYRFVAIGPDERDLVATFHDLSRLVHGGA